MFDAPLGALPKATASPKSSAAAAAAVAVIGSGIAGLSAAWLLSRRYRITPFEAAPQLGGHSHTVEVEAVASALGVEAPWSVPAGAPIHHPAPVLVPARSPA